MWVRKVLTSAAQLASQPRLSILRSLQGISENSWEPLSTAPPPREAAFAVWGLGFWGST